MSEVNVRGFSCPIPVVKTKEAMGESPDEALTVLVESTVSRENVSCLAQSKGYSVEAEETSDGYRLVLHPPGKE